MEPTTRVCKKCGDEKPIEEFAKNNKKRLRIHTCKQCRRLYDEKYRELNKAEIAERKKKYRNKNKEYINATERYYYEKNKERIKYRNERRGEHLRKYKKIRVEETHDNYVAYLLYKQSGAPVNIIRQHPELIKVKSIQIKLKRLANENSD